MEDQSQKNKCDEDLSFDVFILLSYIHIVVYARDKNVFILVSTNLYEVNGLLKKNSD